MSERFIYRFEILPKVENRNLFEQKENELKVWIKKYLDLNILKISEIKYFLIESDTNLRSFKHIFPEVFCDEVIEFVLGSDTYNEDKNDFFIPWFEKNNFKNVMSIDVGFRPGVTDNSAHAALDALKLIPSFKDCNLKVSSGFLYFVEFENSLDKNACEKFAYEKLANNLLHKVKVYDHIDTINFSRMKNLEFPNPIIKKEKAKLIDIFVSNEKLQELNKKNCWALSESELEHIKNHYKKLNRLPYDVEIEIIAQSWSEHCKHKIFASHINYTEENLPAGAIKLGNFVVKGIFKEFIRGATFKIIEDRKINWAISLFHDNAGIVRFDENIDVCIKVETHNSPSALDPYGGALTGILGVNRDILGVGIGAKPIANTNVFCLSEKKYFETNQITIPKLLKNPDRIKEGVHLGVQDGGNKSGIPTVNGAFVFDRDFVGKPLVFCGTVGAIPQEENNFKTSLKRQRPKDLIVMAGGRIGKDGIHGATFSSMELVEGIPSSVVQIGDPITQKRLGDFLIEARKRGLFNSVTDNGAGGLSSSVGEMAQVTNGAEIHLEKALVKYPGLSPYELMVSESQERMTFSVPKNLIEEFLILAKKRSVEASVIGEFNDSGSLSIYYEGENVGMIDMHFLHESLPPMQLKAHFNLKETSPHWIKKKTKPIIENNCDYNELLLQILKSPNVRSHENLIRRYDHEVKASTIVKPFTGSVEKGFSSPNDSGVVWLYPHGGSKTNAISVACGICPKISKYDTYTMALYAVDEAVRNAISVGANPDELVLVDNFCWPDPILSERNPDAQLKLAQLVRAGKALFDISLDYGMPFVSGKDSMKNDFIGPDENNQNVKISVPPTLLVTAMGRVPTEAITTSEIKNSDDLIYLIGENLVEYQSFFELNILNEDLYPITYPLPVVDNIKQLNVYKNIHLAMKNKWIKSCHDVSDGGVLIALAEKMMSTPFGMELRISINDLNLNNFLFNEGMGRFIVSVNKKNQNEFEKIWDKEALTLLGKTTDKNILSILNLKNESILNISGETCLKSYKAFTGEI